MRAGACRSGNNYYRLGEGRRTSLGASANFRDLQSNLTSDLIGTTG